jgi:putative Holliday junction resolvase
MGAHHTGAGKLIRMATRYLAIDLGDKRTGLAVGDDVTGIASPVDVIEATTDALRLDAVAAAIDEHGPDELVLGLPLNMDGSEGPRAKLTRAFASQLHERFALPVHLADERQTSERANQQMARSGLTHGQKKRRRDALAAAVMLQAFLEAGE